MGLSQFLVALDRGGRIAVEGPDLPICAHDESVGERLTEMYERSRLEAPGELPPLRLEAAVWAASLVYRSCQCLVYREIDAQTIGRFFETPCPTVVEPATIISADLTLRYLPDLVAVARGIAVDDPLTAALMRLATDWPLSSVGIANLEAVNTEPIRNHDSLWELYVDRALESGDQSRLQDNAVLESARGRLGLYTHLCPALDAMVGTEERD